jgi:hypothetical protein
MVEATRQEAKEDQREHRGPSMLRLLPPHRVWALKWARVTSAGLLNGLLHVRPS